MRNIALNKLFDDMRFFKPSAQLTGRLVSAIQTAHSADLERVRSAKQQIELDEDMPEDYETDAVELNLESSSSGLELEPEILLQQREIAVELYSLLAFQADSPQALEGQAISILDSVTLGMSVSLGLPKENFLLAEFAGEFCGWLRDEGEFLAGWGRIMFAPSEHMYLEAFPRTKSEVDRSEEELANVG